MNREKFYLGYSNGEYHLFKSIDTPTQKDHPEFSLVWGPFQTKRGALWAQKYGANNPHAQTVSECERLALLYLTQDELCRDYDKHLRQVIRDSQMTA